MAYPGGRVLLALLRQWIQVQARTCHLRSGCVIDFAPIAVTSYPCLSIQIPIAVIVVLIVTSAFVLLVRRGAFSRITNWATGAALASGTVIRGNNGDSPREITAEQLAGGDATATTDGTTTTTTNNGSARAARRPRRNRRTPSQISTKSLPAYMKEPGDQELVIIRYVSSCSLIHAFSQLTTSLY